MAEAHRADQLGSLLRPPEVKEARTAFHEGRVSKDQLTDVEDKAILDELERQKQAGLDVYKGESSRYVLAGTTLRQVIHSRGAED